LYLFRNRNNNLEEYPLHLACQNGQIEVVGKLLQEFSPVTLEHDLNRWSPLHHSAWWEII
jgi:ankyrin repeat protein